MDDTADAEDHASTGSSSQLSSPTSNPPWWRENKSKNETRGWGERPRRKATIPPEQASSYARARKSVAKAVRSVLGTAVPAIHEALILSVEPLTLVPVPGLSEAARTLLALWDALEQVETNRMASISLTQRAADILFAIREEIELAGGKVESTLEDPVKKLTEAFKLCQDTLLHQASKPFLKRYLQRDADLRRIAGCNTALTDAVSLFSLSIQIRTLKQLQASEQARLREISVLYPGTTIPSVTSSPPPFNPALPSISPPPYLPAPQTPPKSNVSLPIPGTPPLKPLPATPPSPGQVLPRLVHLTETQHALDSTLDTSDLLSILRNALASSSDAQLIQLLGVDKTDWPEAIKTLQRRLEDLREEDKRFTVTDTSAGAVDEKEKSKAVSREPGEEVVHREFVESGIECLRRMSGEGDTALPPWTITKYEVDTDMLIGIGSFSSVYRGTYRKSPSSPPQTIALKILNDTTPRSVFLHEIQIWCQLSHRNVLQILGASSATGDPPWFFVSPYMKNGSLVKYLKEGRNGGGGRQLTDVEKWMLVHQISVGMEYLHSKDVLHGDLKGANVLIDDYLRCVISDFGQSRLKSEVMRLTGRTANPSDKPGTVRWVAPELLKGESELTTAVDIYAFALTCVEVILDGEIPWSSVDDATVLNLVIKENRRPSLPTSTPRPLAAIVRSAWDANPDARPSFTTIASNIETFLVSLGATVYPRRNHRLSTGRSPSDGQLDHFPSPELRPAKESPSLTPSVESSMILDPKRTDSFPKRDKSPLRGLGMEGMQSTESRSETEDGSSSSYKTAAEHHSIPFDSVFDDNQKTPKAVPNDLPPIEAQPPSKASSLFSSTDSTRDTDLEFEWDGYDSPPPQDERVAMTRDERRYRLLLTHDYYNTLKLPLWSPTPVRVGALGYHSRPTGQFITLFNAFETASDEKDRQDPLPSLHGYGIISQDSVRNDSRTAKERAFEGLRSMIPFSRMNSGTTRRATFPLRAGHKHAYLYAETTVYRYMSNLTTPKKWLKSNIDSILRIYGTEHRLQKEDILLIVGTLEAPDYALFVSHKSRDGQVHFEVSNDRRAGQPWGVFKTDHTAQRSTIGGPTWLETEDNPSEELYSTKFSHNGDSAKAWDALILARLRFRPDEDDPTSQ